MRLNFLRRHEARAHACAVCACGQHSGHSAHVGEREVTLYIVLDRWSRPRAWGGAAVYIARIRASHGYGPPGTSGLVLSSHDRPPTPPWRSDAGRLNDAERRVRRNDLFQPEPSRPEQLTILRFGALPAPSVLVVCHISNAG